MTICDHGIRLDRWCADCEDGFTFAKEITETYATRRRDLRRRSGTLAVLTFAAMAAIVLSVVVTRSVS